jgi:transcriptional regulator with XRE-family HTH domain
MTVGAELAQARQKLGLTLEDVSARTRISVDRLAAIEEGDVPRLPSFVYLKGFLRAFASEVHLDPESITSRYLAALDAEAIASLDSHTSTIVLPTEGQSALEQFAVESEPQPSLPTPPPAPVIPHAKPHAAPIPDSKPHAAPPPPAATRAPAAARARVAEDRTSTVALAMPALDYESELSPRSRKQAARSVEARPGVSGPYDLGTESDDSFDPDGDAGDLLLDSPLYIEPGRSGGAPRFLDVYGDDEVAERRERRSVRFGVSAIVVLVIAVFTGWTLGENYSAILARIGTYVPVVAQQIAGAVSDLRPEGESSGRTGAPDVAASVPSASSSIATNPSNAQDAAPQGSHSDAERLQATGSAHISPALPAAAMVPADQHNGDASAGQMDASESDGPSEERRASAGDHTQPTVAPQERSRSASAEPPPAASGGAAREAAGATAPSSTRSASAPPSPGPTTPGPASPARDFGLTGRWTFTNRVESSVDGAAAGTNVSFHIQLRQDGARISGTGEKWMENGRQLSPSSRTPINVEGRLIGDRLELTYVERGLDGMTTGSFALQAVDRDTLWGEFFSPSPETRGSVLARRDEAPRE